MEYLSEMPLKKEKPVLFKKVKNFLDSDFFYSFKQSKVTMISFFVLMTLIVVSTFADFFAPYNVFDPYQFDLFDSELAPLVDERYLLGTDIQGRDVLSLIIQGMQTSLIVGAISVAASVVLGIFLGVVSGYIGGRVDSIIMRFADAMLSFPTIMFALLVSGIARGIFPKEIHNDISMYVIIFSITLTGWMQYARTVRGATKLEGNKEYVQAARVMGSSSSRIMLRHILPNVVSPVLVLATLHLALAILTEATLSFLGVGMPPNMPSLGTLINEGNQYLFSGQWWVVLFPSFTLVLIALSVNLVGDWLRDALNPKLR
jgi:peptide/nickel transport system permease protein